MRIVKYITAVWAFVYPCICLALARNISYGSKFTDDICMLIIFSALVCGEIIFNIKSRSLSYIKSVLSLWFPISAIYHWLTTNDWYAFNICCFAIYFAATALFAFTQLAEFFKKKSFSTARYIFIPAALTLILTFVNINVSEDALSPLSVTVFVFLMITQIANRWFPNSKTASTDKTDNDEYPIYNYSYTKLFFRILCIVLFAGTLASVILYFMDANLLTKLTRPSAFYYTAETFMPLPGLIWLAICSFAPKKVSYKAKNTLLFTQSAIVAAKVFFDLRLRYFDYHLTNTATYIGLLALLFFVFVYCYYNFIVSKFIPILTGTACIALICVSLAVERRYFDATSAAMLINIFAFICTLIDDHIADCKLKKDLKLLQAKHEKESEHSNEEPVCIEEGKHTDN